MDQATLLTEISQTDIDTLEQENRLMRARMERVEGERDELLAALVVCADQFDAYAEHHRAKSDDDKFHRNQLLAFNARAVIAKVQP